MLKEKLFLIVLFCCGIFISCNNEHLSDVNVDQTVYQEPIVHSSNGGGYWLYLYDRWVWVDEVPGWDGGGPNDGSEDTDTDTGNDDETGEVSNPGGGDPPPTTTPPSDLLVRDQTSWSKEVYFFDNFSRENLTIAVQTMGKISVMFRCEFLEGGMDYRYSRDKLQPLSITGGPSNRNVEYIDWDGDEDFYEFHYKFWTDGTYHIHFKMPNNYAGSGRVKLTIIGY